MAYPACLKSDFQYIELGSIASRVPPALINTLLPTKSAAWRRVSLTALTILTTSGYLPTPTSGPVSRPESGSTITYPRDRKVSIFVTVLD